MHFLFFNKKDYIKFFFTTQDVYNIKFYENVC
ncbi:hypothetical protein FHS60_000099 [Alloprevotella rava]|uniref:Uncharacterized protein n=1 Tax=Alloprevotella rava TaxID=671218 RepID=A0A7W5UL29_9BACT|nr:hypothetical protein [Alloprevotella rava]